MNYRRDEYWTFDRWLPLWMLAIGFLTGICAALLSVVVLSS